MATRYKPGFHIVNKYELIGDPLNPFTTIPKELQIFPEKTVVHFYTFTMTETLDWHQDTMKLDELSSGKYATLIHGSGRLEVKDSNEKIESYEFQEKYRWVKFSQLDFHRFIPFTETKMLMANTISNDNLSLFGIHLYTAINSDVTYPKIKCPEERKIIDDIRAKFKKNSI